MKRRRVALRALGRGARCALLLLLALLAGCDTRTGVKKLRQLLGQDSPLVTSRQSREENKKSRSEPIPLGPPVERPEPKPGMIYIPPGALVVGTPPDKRPRRADRELPGEQIMLDGYYIDQFPFPNEEGAIPVTSVSQSEAEALCAERGKRLCSELEWERGCKGPDNRSYEYGEVYKEDVCRTGRIAALIPSGYNVACQSDFGVHDMHGGPFEWTSDDYGRGSKREHVVLRGGNGEDGEVAGRCANLEPHDPSDHSGMIGFRCCAGEPNSAQVELERKFPPGLIPRVKFDEEVEKSLIAALPPEARDSMSKMGPIERQRVWLWRPVANEELHLIALCGRGPRWTKRARCGILFARLSPARVQTLAWVSTGEWVSNLHRPGPQEMVFVLGGEKRGSFKRLVRYRTGDILVGDLSWGGIRTKKK